MATTKKPAAKKSTSRAASTASKRTPAKKAPVKAVKTTKKPPVKKASVKKNSAKRVTMRSFHVSRDSEEFNSFRITRQTIYWIILVSFIIFAQLWILKLQVEIATLLEAQQQTLMDMN